MIHHRKILLIASLFSVLSFLTALRDAGPETSATKWVVQKGGSLQVTGSTNINTFSCAITGYSNPDTLVLYNSGSRNETINLKGGLSLDVSLFDCRNPIMTSDLRKTLKAKQYPALKIKFINLARFPMLSSQTDNIKGVVDIELAGTTRRFEVNYKFYRDQQKLIRLIGERFVNFSDFNLTPPRKLGGMIQTDNRLKVEFNLGLRSLN